MAKQQKKQIVTPIAPQEKKATSAQPKPLVPVVDWFEKMGDRGWMLAGGVILLISVIVFRDYLFSNKIYLFKDIACDSYNLTYPNLYNTADYMSHYGLPKWSFASGMGQSLFPFFLRDPFDLFLYLAGKDNIFHGLVFLEVVKVVLAGSVFYLFLKQLKLSNIAAFAGSLMFAFCGYMMEGSGWYIFTYEALNFAVLLLAFELLFNKGSWYLFPIAIFGIGISMPFNLYVYGIFVAVYGVLRCYTTNGYDLKRSGVLYLKMLGLGVLGLMLAGPFLLENIVQLLESPRGSGITSLSQALSSLPMFDTADKMEFGTGIMRFFSTDLMHSGDNFKGWQNILEAPLYYCGLPCLILMPQVFGFFDKKKKIAFAVFLVLWLFPMFFPYFRHAFWLFTGDYYRAYSFFVGVVFIIYTVMALDGILKVQKVNLVVLVITLVVWLMLLNYPYFEDPEAVSSSLKAYIVVMLFAYAGVALLLWKQSNNVTIRYVFVALLVTEMLYLPGITIGERDSLLTSELPERTGYNDYTVDAVKMIRKSDPSFYRIDKAYSSGVSRFATINDEMVQGYYGTSSYNPFNQLYYIKYLQLFDLAQKGNELDARWARSSVGKPILECENRVKYMLAKGNNINPFWRVICDSVGMTGDIKIFRNKWVLPMGYMYHTFIYESDFTRLTQVQKELVSLRTCVLSEKDLAVTAGLNEFKTSDTFAVNLFTPDSIFNAVTRLRSDSMVLSEFGETHLAGSINAGRDGLVYLSIPFDNGWNLSVDGQTAKRIVINGGMTGIYLKAGQHKIDLRYELRNVGKGTMMSFAGLILFVGLAFWTRKKKPIKPKISDTEKTNQPAI